jgi:hypothetical protein
MPEPKMIRREPPEFIRFSAGVTVEGVLLRIGRVRLEKGPASVYTVRRDNGKLCRFLGLTAIDDQIYLSDVGKKVCVHCVGEDVHNQQEGKNAMKVFEIDVSEGRNEVATAGDDDLGITDDDLPF